MSLRSRAPAGAWLLLFACLVLAAPAGAQDDIDEVFGNLGKASRVEGEATATARAGEGTVRGRVFDGEQGAPVAGATVILVWPDPADGGAPRQEVQVSGPDGAFEFASVPPGSYSLSFVKSGYRTSTMKNFEVQADQVNPADFPLPPLPPETAGTVLELEAFVVEASTVDDMMASLELRMESDVQLNIMSAEELSKFAAGDVAEALKRVAGVNVVEGQFAIIRGLEDRYSSTLYNGAPVPSPDPDRQSVQLDLLPSEVVSNLLVAKSFSAELPSNSSGGSIDIVTHEYAESRLELKMKGGSGFNSNARDRFLGFEDNSPIGSEEDGSDVTESEWGMSLGGRRTFLGREVRYKGVYNNEIDYTTGEGFVEKREPVQPTYDFRFIPFVGPTRVVATPGGMANGELGLSGGKFDLTTSNREEQRVWYAGLGFDLDEEGDHRIDSSFFYSKKWDEAVQLEENGFIPGFDYAGEFAGKEEVQASSAFSGFATRTAWTARRTQTEDRTPLNGHLWYAPTYSSKSFDVERDLIVYQVNGEHEIADVPGLKFSWAWNTASTTQDEDVLGARFFYQPVPKDDPLGEGLDAPLTVQEVGPGLFVANEQLIKSDNDIDEDQNFFRLDGEYEMTVNEGLRLTVSTGGWYERATRDVDSSFLETPVKTGLSNFATSGEDQVDLGRKIFPALDDTDGVLAGEIDTTAEGTRHIRAWNVGSKATFSEKLDVLTGLRVESIYIESTTDPFTDDPNQKHVDGTTSIFPSKYLWFDRLDNESRGEFIPANPVTFNDQILGIDLKKFTDPDTGFVDIETDEDLRSLLSGEIDETKLLPSLGLAYRPVPGLSLRGAWTRTVARPSFREMGYYRSVERGTDDLVIGNPQLQLSDVESIDTRIEYAWGDWGDLAAVSLFRKTIDDPIESIVVRNPVDLESDSALYRTFFNNPNTASLWGLEVETRKNLGFLGTRFLPDIGYAPVHFFEYFTVGGNYTYIDAEVDRIDAELERSQLFFDSPPDEVARFDSLDSSRRLFGQPEWILNLDLSFDHPGWGTKLTLAWFSISDVLDAAGSVAIAPNGEIASYTPDRYVDEFDTLDLILSQRWRSWTFKLAIKNLTDSKRRLIYDPDQTAGRVTQREQQFGQDYSFSIGYEVTF